LPYILTQQSISKVKQFFDALQGDVMRFEVVDPQRMAFNLRQALAAAKALGIPKPPYCFKVVGKEVIAIPVGEVAMATRSDIKNALELVAQLMILPPTSLTHYPALVLTESEFVGLAEWCASHHLAIEKREPGCVIRPEGNTE
jgi:hypothetical protein